MNWFTSKSSQQLLAEISDGFALIVVGQIETCSFGIGYVGLSNSIILAQHSEVLALDVVAKKVEMINREESAIIDAELDDYPNIKPVIKCRATLDGQEARRSK